MRSTLRILFIFLALINIASFAFAEHVRFQEISNAGMSYELVVEADALEVMKPLPFKINVSTRDGAPVSVAQITSSLTMPAMAMPSNKPPVKEGDHPGQYKGIFLLTMGGLWHVELASTYSSGQKDLVVIPIQAVVPEGGGETVDSKLEDLFHENKTGKD